MAYTHKLEGRPGNLPDFKTLEKTVHYGERLEMRLKAKNPEDGSPLSNLDQNRIFVTLHTSKNGKAVRQIGPASGQIVVSDAEGAEYLITALEDDIRALIEGRPVYVYLWSYLGGERTLQEKVTFTLQEAVEFDLAEAPVEPIAPTLAAAPSFSLAEAEAGDTIGITPPTFAGTPPIEVAFTLTLDGVSVLDDLADDNGALSIVTAAGELVATWTASNAAGDGEAVSISLTVDEATVAEPAPTAANALPDLTFTQNSGARTVDAAADFSNATGGTWSVTGAGATITQAGLVTVPDTAVLSAASVVVTYAKAGFPDATSAFSVTVEEEVVDPDPVTLAALTLSAASVAEDAAQGVVVGAVQGRTDGSSLTLTDTAGDRFALSGTNIITGPTALDYEAGTSHDITVRETLAGATNTPRETTLSIAVTDVADTEAPTFDAPLPDQTVTQGEAITPVDLGDHFSHPREAITYALLQSPEGIGLTGSTLSGTIDAAFTPGAETIRVSATAEGLTTEATFTLTVEEIVVQPPSEFLPVNSGLVARYDMDSLVTDGSGITGWSDASGNGNNLAMLGNPTIAADATPSGASAVALDGTGDGFQRLAATDPITGLPAGAGDRTVFFVADYLNPQGGTIGFAYGASATNDAFGLTINSSGFLRLQGWGLGNDFTSTADGLAQGFMVQSAVVSANAWSHYLDGNLIHSGTHTYSTEVSKIALGVSIGTSTNVITANVCAALIYDRALSEAERAEVEAYLQHKYVSAPPEMSLTMTSDGFTGATVPSLASNNLTLTSEGFS